MSALERLAADIAASGIGRVFAVSGSGQSLDLLDRLERLGVEIVAPHSEAAAAIMAGTVGRLAGRAGVALSIKGPGLANMLPGLAACYFEAWPLVALAEAFGPEVPLARAHKRLDQHALVAAVAKVARRLSEAGPGFEDLAALAEAEAPGPVLLELAGRQDTERLVDLPPPQRGMPEAVLRAVEQARHPVVIAGTLALRQGWAGRLNTLRLPVFTTAAAKGAVDERLPHAAGVYTGVGLEEAPEKALLAHADLAVALGLRPGEVLATPLPVPAVHLDPIVPPGADGFALRAWGNAEAVFDALSRKAWGVDETMRATSALELRMLAGPFSPAHALRAVAGTLGPQVRLAIDTGYFCTVAEHAWRAPQADLCLSSGSGRYMGIAVAQALGAALWDGGTPTVALAGDGGIAPFLGECDLAARRRLPVCILFLTDGGYGSVRTRAIKDGLTQRPLVFPEARWRLAFEGLGWSTARAEGEAALAGVLGAWRPAEGPLFVEVPFDPDAYQAMVEGIR